MVDYNRQIKDGTINRAEEFLRNLGDGDAEEGYKNLEEELLHVDIGSHYLSEGKQAFFQIFQDALYCNSIIESNVILTGQDTFDELMEMTNASKVKNDTEIKQTREEFLNYVYQTWKGKE